MSGNLPPSRRSGSRMSAPSRKPFLRPPAEPEDLKSHESSRRADEMNR